LPVTLFLFSLVCLLFVTALAASVFYTLSLHDALPIWFCEDVRFSMVVCLLFCHQYVQAAAGACVPNAGLTAPRRRGWCWRSRPRSEEHTSELQSRFDLVCRLLLEKKKERKTVDAGTDQ